MGNGVISIESRIIAIQRGQENNTSSRRQSDDTSLTDSDLSSDSDLDPEDLAKALGVVGIRRNRRLETPINSNEQQDIINSVRDNASNSSSEDQSFEYTEPGCPRDQQVYASDDFVDGLPTTLTPLQRELNRIIARELMENERS